MKKTGTKKEERDPCCLAVGCKLDGRNCDLSKCDRISGKSSKEPLLGEGKILCEECDGYHG